MSVIECIGLTKVYRDSEDTVHALRDVSLSIEQGEFLSLVGPSGSGKTTLLNVIGALDYPSEGSVVIDGVDIVSLSASDRTSLRLHTFGFIFQSYNLIPVLSAQENVEFVMQLQGVERRERGERSQAALQSVGLGDFAKRRPGELSGGQQQRVAIARAIASNPRVILADEPTANLDSQTAEQLLDLMLTMNQTRGVTFIFSTHDPRVMDYARRIVRLRDGKIETEESELAAQ